MHGDKTETTLGELRSGYKDYPVTSAEQVWDYSRIDTATNKPKTLEQVNTDLYTISEGKADKSELIEAIDAINESIATLPGSFDVYSANVGDTIPEGAALTWDGAPVETRIAEVNETKTLMVACTRVKENNADWPNPKQVRLLTFVLGHSLVATSAANDAKPFDGFQDEDIDVAHVGYNGTPQEIYFNTVKGCFVGKTGNAIQGYTYYNSWSNDADYRNNAASNVFVYTSGQVARYYRYVENGGYVMGNITNFSQLSADLKEVWGGAQGGASGNASASGLGMKPGETNAAANAAILRQNIAQRLPYLFVDGDYYIDCSGEYFDIDYDFTICGNGSLTLKGPKFIRPLEGSHITIDGVKFVGTMAGGSSVSQVISTDSPINYVISGIEIRNCSFIRCKRVVYISGADLDYNETNFGITRMTVENNYFYVTTSQFVVPDIIFSQGLTVRNNRVQGGQIYTWFNGAVTNADTEAHTYEHSIVNAMTYNGDWIFEGNVVSDSVCVSGSTYHTMLVAETRRLIVCNNTISNIITFGTISTYDTYGSCNDYVFKNNVIKNVCALSTSSTNSGSEIFKSKGNGGSRIATGNTWDIDFEECNNFIKSRGYAGLDATTLAQKSFTDIFGFTSNIDLLNFSGNTIILKNGGLRLRQSAYSHSTCVIKKSILCNNIFKVDKTRGISGTSYGVLLPVWNTYGNVESIIIKDNIFNFNATGNNTSVVGLIGNSGNDTGDSSMGLDVLIEGNIFSRNVNVIPNYPVKRIIARSNKWYGADVAMSTYMYGSVYGENTLPSYIETETYINADSETGFKINNIGNRHYKRILTIEPTNRLGITIAYNTQLTAAKPIIDMRLDIGIFKTTLRLVSEEGATEGSYQYGIYDLLGNKIDSLPGDSTTKTVKIFKRASGDANNDISFYKSTSAVLLYVKNTTTEKATFTVEFADPALNTFKKPALNSYSKGVASYDSRSNKPVWWNGSSWINAQGEPAGILTKGTIANAPSSSLGNTDVGVRYFATDLGTNGKPVFWSGTLWVDAAGTPETWPVKYTLTNISTSNTQQAVAGGNYSTALITDDGYALPSAVTVKVNGVSLIPVTDYTYDSETGEIVILSTSVNGAITIEATGADPNAQEGGGQNPDPSHEQQETAWVFGDELPATLN